MQIEKFNQRIHNAEEDRLDRKIEIDEYRDIKNRYEKQIREQEQMIIKVSSWNNEFQDQLEFTCTLLTDILKYYESLNVAGKQQLVGAIFPEKLVFEGNSHRTIRVNEVILLISRTVADFMRIKKEKASENGGHSNVVHRTGIYLKPTISHLKNLGIQNA